MSTEPPVLSVVVPVYDEREVLPLFVARIRPVLDRLGVVYELIAVDDGSTDGTRVLLRSEAGRWPQLRVLRLRRNAGHQAALTAGLDSSRGSYVVTIDADLQDPPELIADMLAVARAEQVDVVYAVRASRAADSVFKRSTARLYYRLMRRIAGVEVPAHAGDFRLMSRAVVTDLGALPERHRVYRLLVPWLGHRSATLSYDRDPRAAGRTHYPLRRMVRLGLDSVTAFSGAPLRWATWLGGGGAAVALVFALWAVGARIAGHVVPGWTSVLLAVLFLGAVQLLCVGLLGEYLGRLFEQAQGRPTYYLEEPREQRGPDRPADRTGTGDSSERARGRRGLHGREDR